MAVFLYFTPVWQKANRLIQEQLSANYLFLDETLNLAGFAAAISRSQATR